MNKITRNQKSTISGRKSDIVRQRSAIGTLLLTSAICLLSSGAIFADMTDGDVDKTRAALEKWVETRRIISQEKRDFELGREMLTERIELVQREIESLRGKIGEAEKSITEADKKRAELLEENEKLKEASASLSGTVIKLEARTREFLKRLPDPIRERVKPLSQRFPENPDETKLSLGERFQNIVGVLNEVNKFNREITVTSEVRKLPDGTSAEVTALYIGIGQAYYVNGKGDVAGIGTASPEGWVWTPANKAAAGIAKAIAILKNETAAAFVQLPVEIQ
jgi:septal ring factor EnvC (AmiA/AmiB activator)